MKSHDVQARIPSAIAKLHSEGEPAAFYDEIMRKVLQDDERYVARRTAIRSLLSKIHIDYPIIPEYPMSPGAQKVYPALSRLETRGLIEGRFQPEQEDGKPARRMYRLAQDPDSIKAE